MQREVAINPGPGVLGVRNAVLSGRARQYDVRAFAGPLSIKTVVSGRATWTTSAGSFEIAPGAALILNAGEEYDIAIDALQPVETFCVFFSRGFVEDAYRAATSTSAALIDAPPPEGVIEVGERLSYDAALIDTMERAHAAMQADREIAAHVVGLANALVRSACDVEERVSRLPALRLSTRIELQRRIERARDYIHANIASPLPLESVAAAACLSLFHFHRLFAAFYRETPHRFITRVRLERACALLRGGRSVTDVAQDCGFESIGSFTTLFTRRFGISPGRFRKNEEDRRRITS